MRQPCSADDDDRALLDGRRTHIVARQLAIGAPFTIVGQRKSIRRLDRQDDRARSMLRLARDVARLDTLALQEREHEVADLILANGCEEGRPQPQPPRADADVRWTAADVRVEARHFGHRHADLMRIQIDRAAADGEHIVARDGHGAGGVWRRGV